MQGENFGFLNNRTLKIAKILRRNDLVKRGKRKTLNPEVRVS